MLQSPQSSMHRAGIVASDRLKAVCDSVRFNLSELGQLMTRLWHARVMRIQLGADMMIAQRHTLLVFPQDASFQ